MGRIQAPNHELLNPCLKEQNLAFKCLNDNNYDKEKCLKAMENYQYCKSFWGFVQSQRRREGKYPLLPLIENREEVKKAYIKDFLKQL